MLSGPPKWTRRQHQAPPALQRQSQDPDFKLVSQGGIPPWENTVEKTMEASTTQKHASRQGHNYGMARQGFHYKWGPHLRGTQFFPAGGSRGQLFCPLGNFPICLPMGRAGVGEGTRAGGGELGSGINSMDFCPYHVLKLKLRQRRPTKQSARAIKAIIPA